MAKVVHGTLEENVVAKPVVTLASNRKIEITNVDGAAAIYFRLDATDPTVEGENCEVLPAAVGASLTLIHPRSGSAEVRLISEGTPKFSLAARS